MTMARIGYARVSTDEQTLDLQIDALEAADCTSVFSDHGISAIAKLRPGFENALKALCPGDTFIIWKMDRAFRSLRHALDVFEHFERERIELLVLTEGIDTTTPMGKCFYQIRNAFSELERNLISERTKAGLEAARKRGVRLGRPLRLNAEQRADVLARVTAGECPRALASTFEVHPRTIRRAVTLTAMGSALQGVSQQDWLSSVESPEAVQ